ncbi:MAG: hypothetical protein HQK83_12120 [Fibrobacteria bacterium]|nr:hypothetical protein [Fibrobacteria bacterium]
MTTAKIAFIHTSPAAIAPLKDFYSQYWPGCSIINMLDDGLLGLFKNNDHQGAGNRIVAMINDADKAYGVAAAMITCTAVPKFMLSDIEQRVNIPVVKIDVPMTTRVVNEYQKIGLVATFRPGGEAAENLFRKTAEDLHKMSDIRFILIEEAYEALLDGNVVLHDQLLLNELVKYKNAVDAFVLSQVSMVELQSRVEERTGKPVFTSPRDSMNVLKRLTT